MNRTNVVVVTLAGALGLAIGWLGLAPVPKPPQGASSAIAAVPQPVAAAPRATRHEFPLGPEDVGNDRETPAVAVDRAGRVVLAWAAQSGPLERTLYLARSSDGGKRFEAPSAFRKVPIYRYASQGKGKKGGTATMYSTHVLPRLAATTDGLYLGWVEAIDGGPEVAYFIARSTDGGATFAPPFRAHATEARKPGFTTLAAAPDGTLLAAWLDGRNQGPQPFCAAKPADSEGFGTDRLVFAGPTGKGICPCCDVSAARLPDGSDVVAFRNNESGERDIWLSRARPGASFEPPAPLSRDRWKFDGCPHDGPSLAVAGDRLYAVWMSAHSGRNRVYFGCADATELSFTARDLSAGTPGAQGHPRLIAARPGQLYAVWDESNDAAGPAPSASSHGAGHGHGPSLSGSGRSVMLASGDERGFRPAAAVAPRPGAFQLNPALAAAPDGTLLITWSEIDTTGKHIVFVRASAEDR